ncbi:MAG: AAA family ATPase, partial [Caldilineaceae bacterium SB0675_bin_29]|nr:AAA family ATPase [Caldilineaceae bacterium SB0675_bin_29]
SPETRYVNSDNQVHIESVESQERPGRIGQSRQGPESSGGGRRRQRGKRAEERAAQLAQDIADSAAQPNGRKVVRVFPYGIGQNRLRTAAQNLKVPIEVVKELRQADIVMTLKNYFRQKPQPIADAERQNVPVYVLRSNTVTQMEHYLLDVFQLRRDDPDLVFDSAMRETQHAIQRLLKGEKSVELSPQEASIRSQQHQLARTANLISHSYGREPHRCVRIFSPS